MSYTFVFCFVLQHFFFFITRILYKIFEYNCYIWTCGFLSTPYYSILKGARDIMPKKLQYLTKRRTNQLIMRELNYHSYCALIELPKSVTVSNVMKDTKESLKNVDDLPNKINNILNNSLIENFEDFEDYDIINDLKLHSYTKDNEKYNTQNSTLPISNVFDHTNKSNLREDIKRLIIEQNISHNTAKELLTILRKHGHKELPKDVRVLLHTPRNASENIKYICGGSYIHFGLSSGLKRSIEKYSNFIKGNEIKLDINIDGLPIAKSSGSQFWPILASLENIGIYTLPFVIGVYHGMHKPNDVNEFLLDFVNEFILLSQTGIIVSEKKYAVTLNAILCDTLAKSFITSTKGHNGYFSCSECTQEGDFVQNRVVFLETENSLRTNDTFRNRSQIEHHTGNSILEQLHIGMVSQIPLDYMHLVCLGVVKRLLQLWIRGGKNVRLPVENINCISHHLIAIKSHITSEFARKPKGLDNIDRWKATELRQFLLYTGIVIMNSVLSPIIYSHFLSLSIAIRILIDEHYCIKFNTYANLLLLWFVFNYGKIYGNQYISHNVHNLLHLANDVKRFGSLDNFSCFKYENHMQKLKRKLKQLGAPLQELSNRLSEETQLPIVPYLREQYPIVVYKKNIEISHLQFKSFTIAENEIDNCALLSDRSLIFVLKILQENDDLYVRAKRFLNPKSLFTIPCSSKTLGIFIISNTTNFDIITVLVTQIERKCLKIKSLHEIGSYTTISMLLNNN